MRKGPIISVLLTTYNRVKFLETTILIFISQITSSGLTDQIEIIIGNDASSDGTAEYLNDLQSKYGFIKVVNHDKSLGLSGNLESIIAMASGEYFLFFGDDDLIVEGTLKRLLSVISAHDPNYILINTKNILSLDDRNIKYEIDGDKRLAINGDIFVKDYKTEAGSLSGMKNWLYLTGLLSAVACKKKVFLDCMAEAREYVREDNVYLYQAPIIIGIAKLGKLHMIADPLILHRKNENNWSNSVDGILTVNLYDSYGISNILRKYMPYEYSGYKKRFAAFTLAVIISAKKRAIGVNKYIIDAIARNYDCYPYNFRFFAALFIPGIIFKRLF